MFTWGSIKDFIINSYAAFFKRNRFLRLKHNLKILFIIQLITLQLIIQINIKDLVDHLNQK
jgi:hypothetical protein